MEDNNLKNGVIEKGNGAKIRNQEEKKTGPEQPNQKPRRFYRPGGPQRRHFHSQPGRNPQKD